MDCRMNGLIYMCANILVSRSKMLVTLASSLADLAKEMVAPGASKLLFRVCAVLVIRTASLRSPDHDKGPPTW
jgi:hypothetical protein